MDKCFAETNNPDVCKILKAKDCNECVFFKTEKQYKQDFIDSIDALKRKLDKVTFIGLEEKYGLSRFPALARSSRK